MNAGRSTCAMCGDRLAEPYGGFDLPPICVTLLEGGDDVNPDAIAGRISVDLCEECTEISRRMIRKFKTSPLPEYDADAVSWSSADVMSAFTGGDVPPDQLADNGADRRTIADAVATVNAHKQGRAEHILEGRIDRAYVVLLSFLELGLLDEDPTRAIGESR